MLTIATYKCQLSSRAISSARSPSLLLLQTIDRGLAVLLPVSPHNQTFYYPPPNIMAEAVKGSSGSVCNDRCGCPSPCHGGIACRCTSASGADDVVSDVQYSKSTDVPTIAAGKAFRLCGDGCTCIRCSGP